jgi:hypothetical protein
MNQQNTVKFQPLYFWTSLTKFWPFSGPFGILFSLLLLLLLLLLLFGFLPTIFFIFFCILFCSDLKMGYNKVEWLWNYEEEIFYLMKFYEGLGWPEITWCFRKKIQNRIVFSILYFKISYLIKVYKYKFSLYKSGSI